MHNVYAVAELNGVYFHLSFILASANRLVTIVDTIDRHKIGSAIVIADYSHWNIHH